jgi:homoserine O-succinyltransferase
MALAHGETGWLASGGPGRVLRVALVNNMPDAALVATEAHFLGLVTVGAGPVPLEVRRYGLAGIRRGSRVAAYLEREYLALERLWDDEPDVLIVTGSEPSADALVDEPYWSELAGLLIAASARPTSVVLSCLSAHAALLALDGIHRSRLPAKCSGVFAHDLAAGSPLTAGMDRPALMPHSRVNDVATEAVVAGGWEVLMTSPVGWGAITARRGRAELLLLQGHPEYAPAQLLREYRRDVGRYLRGQRPELPDRPDSSVAPGDLPALARFHQSVRAGAATVDDFDWDRVGVRAPGAWRAVAESLYTNWMNGIVARIGSGVPNREESSAR